MMIRSYLISIFFVLVVSCHAAVDSLIIPEGVRYRRASENVNDAALQNLNKWYRPDLARADISRLFLDSVLICGPFLWKELSHDESLAKLEYGRMSFHMPIVDSVGKITQMNKAEGKLFQSPEEQWIFWRAFQKRTEFADLKIRRLAPEELAAFWSMIPFDIEEPIFIVESPSNKTLVLFTGSDNPRIMWIDEFREIRWQKK